jgi:hypothetical protein
LPLRTEERLPRVAAARHAGHRLLVRERVRALALRRELARALLLPEL